jgi:hypothetical protein
MISNQPQSFSGQVPVMRPSGYRRTRERGSRAWLLWVALIILIVAAWVFSGVNLWGPDGVLTSLGIVPGGQDTGDRTEISLPLDPGARTGTNDQ